MFVDPYDFGPETELEIAEELAIEAELDAAHAHAEYAAEIIAICGITDAADAIMLDIQTDAILQNEMV